MADSTTIPVVEQAAQEKARVMACRAVAAADLGKKMREIQEAHLALDKVGVPRQCNQHTLSLAGRINWLSGQLSAARHALESRRV